MLECAGGCIYTGIAIDPEARFREHLAGRGAQFTRMNKPVRIIGKEKYPDKGSALRAERQLKKLKPDAKKMWAESNQG